MLEVHLESAGSGLHMGVLSIHESLLGVDACVADLQGAVYEYLKHASICDVPTASHVRLFNEHHGYELTSVDACQSQADFEAWRHFQHEVSNLNNPCCQDVKSGASGALGVSTKSFKSFKTLAFSFYLDLDVVRVDLAHAWTCIKDHALAQTDRQAVLNAVARDSKAFAACPAFRNDYQVALTAVTHSYLVLSWVSSDLKHNKEFILKVLKQHPRHAQNILFTAGASLRDDDDVASTAIEFDGNALCNASSRIQAKQNVCMRAFETCICTNFLEETSEIEFDLHVNFWNVLQRRANSQRAANLLSQPMQDITKQELLAIARPSGVPRGRLTATHLALTLISLKEAHWSWKADKQVVMLALDVDELKHADASLLQDRNFVLQAVAVRGFSLYHAPAFQADAEVVTVAVKQHCHAWRCVDESLKKHLIQDKKFVLELVRQNGVLLQDAHDCLKQDPEVVLTAVRQTKLSLRFAHSNLLADKLFCCLALEQDDDNDRLDPRTSYKKYYNDNLLCFMSSSLQTDADVVRTALKKNPKVFSQCALQTEEMATFMCSHHGCRVLIFLPDELRSQNVLKAAIEQDAPEIRLPLKYLPTHNYQLTDLAKHYVACCMQKHIPAEVVAAQAKTCCTRLFCNQVLHQLRASVLEASNK